MVFLDWLPSRGFLCPQFLVAFLAGFSWFPCSSQARALSAWRWRTAYCEAVMDRTQKSYTVGHVYWLVVWNIFIFPFSWEFHHPNWLICFKMVKTTNQYIYIYIVIGTRSKVMEKCPKFIVFFFFGVTVSRIHPISAGGGFRREVQWSRWRGWLYHDC